MRGGYSFSGASIPEAAKTFSVAYFPNNAPMVSPTLSTMLTESLKDKFSRQTKLQMVEEAPPMLQFCFKWATNLT